MIIIARLKGGLGNQLFQLLFGLSIASSSKSKLLIDDISILHDYKRTSLASSFNNLTTSFLLQVIFRLLLKFRYTPLGASLAILITDNNANEVDQLLYQHPKLVCCNGYFQRLNMSNQRVNRRIIKFLFDNLCLKNSISSNSALDLPHPPNDVAAIHVRRGDYCDPKNGMKILELEYYINSVQYIVNSKQISSFHIYGLDRRWICEQLIPSIPASCSFISPIPEIQDLIRLSSYRTIISSNSTYSWWATAFSSVRNPQTFFVYPTTERWYEDQSHYKIGPPSLPPCVINYIVI